ncbi:MAG: DUF4097 family beta strand repeat protein [Lachnospiraceae bacterium]|nr:DUF4097 family beta strand repeat protein [Lachnospiraceae bacterium]
MMNKTVKIILIVAACMIPAGAIIAGIGIASGGRAGWSLGFSENGTSVNAGHVEETVELDDFENMELEISTMDVTIKRGDSYSVSYRTRKGDEPVIENDGLTLKIRQPNKIFVMFDFGGLGVDDGYTITVPEEAVPIGIDASISTGDLTVDRVNLSGRIKTSSGDIMISDTEGEMLEIESSTGDINGDKIKVGALSIGSSTGDINILRLFAQDFTSHTSTGDLNINNSELGKASIDTSTGDIELSLNGSPDDYSYIVDTSTGDIHVNGDHTEKHYEKENGSKESISIHTSTGDVDVTVK